MNDIINRNYTIILKINKAYLMLLNFFELEYLFYRGWIYVILQVFLKIGFDHVLLLTLKLFYLLKLSK
jgi:hypothetical protein